MSTNPFYNAILALAYIVVLVTSVFLGSQFIGGAQASILYPMSALAVLVLSVALMAYLFFYQPILLFIAGQREKALKLFLQTVGIFAIGTVAILLTSLIVNG